jgi:hypothetical protein
MDTMQFYNPPKFNTKPSNNGIDTDTTEMVYDNEHQWMADQQMPELGIELQDQAMEEQVDRHLCAVDHYIITD